MNTSSAGNAQPILRTTKFDIYSGIPLDFSILQLQELLPFYKLRGNLILLESFECRKFWV